MPMRRELNQDFFKKWSPEMAYVLGFFAADGSMIQNKRGGKYIEFVSTDRCVLELIKKSFGSTHKIQERLQIKSEWKAQYRIQIGCSEWFNDLTNLGFVQNKSKRLSFPKVPEKYFGDFVRGYFDGDGCIYFNKLKFAGRKKPRWVLLTLFTSGCRPFLDSLWETLGARGVKGGSLKNKEHGFELMFSHKDSVALHRLMYHTGRVLDLYLPRKREKLEKAIQVLKLRS